MTADPFGPILLWMILLFLAACSHAAEVALPFLDEAEWKKRAGQGESRARRVMRLQELTDDKADLVQAAQWMLLLAACVCACAWLYPPLRERLAMFEGSAGGFLAGLILFVPIVLASYALGVQLPECLAVNRPEKTIAVAAMPALFSATVFSPAALACCAVTGLVLKVLRIQPVNAQEHVTEEEIRMMVDIGEEKGTIQAGEKEMIENIFEFNNMTAGECMVHRKDMTALDAEDDAEKILATIRESGLSRFPVYEGDIDNVIGILIARDYLLNACAGEKKCLREMIRPAYFVPESVRTDVLFREMQTRKQHMAIVVDEYGGTGGLITLEDLLEEIVGNIYDEFDPQAEQEITLLPDGRYRVSGSVALDRLGEALNVDFPEDEEYETLGGLVLSCLTEIPADGARPVVEKLGLRISVEEIADRRVEWAIVEKLREDLPEAENRGENTKERL